jgi:hypothetical protein
LNRAGSTHDSGTGFREYLLVLHHDFGANRHAVIEIDHVVIDKTEAA